MKRYRPTRQSVILFVLCMMFTTLLSSTNAQVNPRSAAQTYGPALIRAASHAVKKATKTSGVRAPDSAAVSRYAESSKSSLKNTKQENLENAPAVVPGQTVQIKACGVVLLSIDRRPGEKPRVRIGNLGRKPATVRYDKAAGSKEFDSASWRDRTGLLAIKTPKDSGLKLETGPGQLSIPANSSVITYKLKGKALEVFHLAGEPAMFSGADESNKPYAIQVSANHVLRVPADAAESQSSDDEELIPADLTIAEQEAIGPIEAELKVTGKQGPIKVCKLDAKTFCENITAFDLCTFAKSLIGELLKQMQGNIPGLGGSGGGGGNSGTAGDGAAGAATPQVASATASDTSMAGSEDQSAHSSQPASQPGQTQNSGFETKTPAEAGIPAYFNFSIPPVSDDSGGGENSKLNVTRAWLEDRNGNDLGPLETVRSGNGYSFSSPARGFKAELIPDSDYRNGTLKIEGSTYQYTMDLHPPTGRLELSGAR